MENIVKAINEKAKDHKIILDNKKVLNVSGVEKVLSANSNVVMFVAMKEKVCVTGNDLLVNKFNVDSGDLEIVGQISSIKYQTGTTKGLFGRVFK